MSENRIEVAVIGPRKSGQTSLYQRFVSSKYEQTISNSLNKADRSFVKQLQLEGNSITVVVWVSI